MTKTYYLATSAETPAYKSDETSCRVGATLHHSTHSPFLDGSVSATWSRGTGVANLSQHRLLDGTGNRLFVKLTCGERGHMKNLGHGSLGACCRMTLMVAERALVCSAIGSWERASTLIASPLLP